MGLFEQFQGYVSIPGMLIFLIILTLGIWRRQLNYLIIKVMNAHVTVNGYQIKIMTLLAFINILYFYSELKLIQNLNKVDLTDHKYHELKEKIRFKEQLYFHYRSALMQLTSIVLIFQVYITAAFYESYKPVSDKEKEVRARLNQK